MSRAEDWPVIGLVVGKVKAACDAVDTAGKIELLDILRAELHKLFPIQMPIDLVRWVPLEDVEANDYNPNAVAPREMKLLHTSIDHDGYTQPVVAIYDPEREKYVIVDGFHRFTVCKTYADIRERTMGRIPLVVIDKEANDRMASTVRHNRARGKHSVFGMANLVFAMLENHSSDEEICNELGLEPEELIRLKHVTGFSKLFENSEFRQSWTTARQNKLKRQYEQTGSCDAGDGDGPDSDGETVLAEP